MTKLTYKVDGIPFDTEAQAKVVADRLYLRYERTRTIVIYAVDHHGETSVIETIEAKDSPNLDEEQLDLF